MAWINFLKRQPTLTYREQAIALARLNPRNLPEDIAAVALASSEAERNVTTALAIDILRSALNQDKLGSGEQRSGASLLLAELQEGQDRLDRYDEMGEGLAHYSSDDREKGRAMLREYVQEFGSSFGNNDRDCGR